MTKPTTTMSSGSQVLKRMRHTTTHSHRN